MAAARVLLFAATILGGFLAGGNIDRAFVATPSWEKVGSLAWAEFSRHADLANGLVLYPVEAIGSTVLALTAAVLFRLNTQHPGAGALPLYAAALMSTAGLALTILAAPIMLGIRDMADAGALDQALRGFRFWGNLRGACQVAAFLAMLWALAAWPRGPNAVTH